MSATMVIERKVVEMAYEYYETKMGNLGRYDPNHLDAEFWNGTEWYVPKSDSLIDAIIGWSDSGFVTGITKEEADALQARITAVQK